MANSLNRQELIGNLGKDADIRSTNNGTEVASYTLATTNSYKKDDNWVNDTTWHNIITWKPSDHLKNNLKKGKKVYVAGRTSKREYDDKDGIKRYAVEVISDIVIPLNAETNGEHTQEQKPSSPDNLAEPENNSDLPF